MCVGEKEIRANPAVKGLLSESLSLGTSMSLRTEVPMCLSLPLPWDEGTDSCEMGAPKSPWIHLVFLGGI